MKTNIDFEETIGTLAADPLRFEELLEVWKSKASKIENTKGTFQPRSLGAIERAMSVLSERYVDDPCDSGILAQIKNLSYLAFIVRCDGAYVRGNKVGDHALGKSKCCEPDWFPYAIGPSETLGSVIETAFVRFRYGGYALGSFRARDAEISAPITQTLTPFAAIYGSSTEVAVAPRHTGGMAGRRPGSYGGHTWPHRFRAPRAARFAGGAGGTFCDLRGTVVPFQTATHVHQVLWGFSKLIAVDLCVVLNKFWKVRYVVA